MKDKEVLQKAIEIAIENGYNPLYAKHDDPEIYALLVKSNKHYQPIFSHNFAKAFWGEDDWILSVNKDGEMGVESIKEWQYHLQQMVLEENPINYFRKFINTEKR